MEQTLIRVTENDEAIGSILKTAAHKEGILHRAFSVFIFSSDGKWLLQQRADSKYHSPGLWSNSCCGHPSPGEDTKLAAENRLQFEMGIKADTEFVFKKKYFAELDHGMKEHELDHVFIGISDSPAHPRPDEVQAVKYLSFDELQKEISDSPGNFTAWFKLLYLDVESHRSKMFS